MNEIISFIVRNWQLSSLLVLFLAAYLVYEFMQSASNNDLTPEQAVELVNHKHGVVVDVRTPEEFAAGHIINAINFDSNEFDVKLKKLNKYTDKPVILVCAHGRRSTQCLTRLQANGFKQVYSLAGGMQAWQNAGLPLVYKTEEK